MQYALTDLGSNFKLNVLLIPESLLDSVSIVLVSLTFSTAFLSANASAASVFFS